MSNQPLAPRDSTFILSFVLPDDTKLCQEAPTDAYLWDILTIYQGKFKTNLLSKQNENGEWLVPCATYSNIQLLKMEDWHQTARQLNLHTMGLREVSFKLEFKSSGKQIFESQGEINVVKSRLPRQKTVTSDDIFDPPSDDVIMSSTVSVANNDSNDSNDSNNDIFDNASRRPQVSTSDRAGYERVHTEDQKKMGQIGRQLYQICKDAEDAPKFATAKKTLRAIVSNLLKPDCTERHRKLRLTNEKLINNLLQFGGSKEFLSIIGFVPVDGDAENLVYPEAMLKRNEGLLQNALKQINEMRHITREAPIPKVPRDLKVYRSDELHKYRIAHSGLDELDEKADDNDIDMTGNNGDNGDNGNNGGISGISGVVGKKSKYGKKNNVMSTYMQSRGVGKGGNGNKSQQKQMEARRAEMKALKMAMKDAKIQNKLKNPEKLMSEAKRKELLGITEKKYMLSLIQVEFPTKLVLEGSFHPREPISALAEYVNEALDPNFLAVCPQFKLILPPREELKDFTKSFKDMSMIPACTVRFVADVPSSYKGMILKGELCAKISSEYTQIQSEVKPDNAAPQQNGKNGISGLNANYGAKGRGGALGGGNRRRDAGGKEDKLKRMFFKKK